MDRRLLVFLIVAVSLIAGGAVTYSLLKHHRAFNPGTIRPKLIVYTYSTFRDALGPGPEIVEKFKKQCMCDVELVDAGAGRLLLEKVRMSQGAQIDVVLGLDQLNLKVAAQNVQWRTLKVGAVNWDKRIERMRYPTFLPYDWSPLTFVYREGQLIPDDDLLEWVESLPDKSLALQDPALSSPGLQFLFWIYTVAQDDKFDSFFRKLKPKIHSISPRWSDAYSVFQSGHAKGAFTYLTSLVYHWVEEKDRRYKVSDFKNGHPLQIEYMGVPETCLSCGIAEEFVRFLLQPENQRIIMERNYMLPAVAGVVDGTPYEYLPDLELINIHRIEEFVDHQRDIIKRWEQLVK